MPNMIERSPSGLLSLTDSPVDQIACNATDDAGALIHADFKCGGEAESEAPMQDLGVNRAGASWSSKAPKWPLLAT